MKKSKTNTRPPLESLACVNPQCDLYGQKGRNKLTIRKVYGQDQIRYLRCHACGEEFSERKNTTLWNSKVPEAKAISIAEHLADGCSLKGIVDKLRLLPVCQGQLLVNPGNFNMNFSVLKCEGRAIGGCSSPILLIRAIKNDSESQFAASLRKLGPKNHLELAP